MTHITENHIEQLAIERRKGLGYAYFYAPDIAPDGATPERDNYAQVLLLGRLQQAVK